MFKSVSQIVEMAATFPCYGHFEKEMTWKNLDPSPRMPVANEGLYGFSKLKISWHHGW